MITPEFDIFKRLEKLEDKTKGEITAKDAFIMGAVGLELAFLAASLYAPQHTRKYKDDILKKLKVMGLDKYWLDELGEDLRNACNFIEQLGQ